MELLLAYSNKSYVRDRVFKLLTLPDAHRSDLAERAEPQRQRHLIKTQTSDLVRRHQRGETVHQLGVAYGVNRRTVSIILKREGVETRWKALSDEQVDEAIELYGSGMSLADVAAHCNVNPTTVGTVLERRGVERRPVGSNQ